jgi:hypothetical protein
VLFAVTFAAACSDKDPAGPEASFPSGSVSFSYSLDEVSAGTFSASGALRQRSANEIDHATFAAAALSGRELGVMAFKAGANNRGDMFILAASNVTGPRTIQINDECLDGTNSACAGVVLLTNTSLANGDDEYDHMCFLASGSITISSIANKRAQGTFSGEGVCLNSEDVIEFTVSGGTFDAPVIDGLRIE